MKGALILSKDPDFFRAFVGCIRNSGMRHIAAENSIKILSADNEYVMVYQRTEVGDVFNEFDIPSQAASSGYQYAFVVECRNERVFCNTIGSEFLHLDMLICDSDGALYWPHELSPESIVL